MSGVKVYTGQLQPMGGGWDFVGETNSKGVTGPGALLRALLGIAPNGAVAVSKVIYPTEDLARYRLGGKLVFGPTGTIRLHLDDNRGRALADREVILFPAETPGPLGSTGYLRPVPDVPAALQSILTRRTNASGDAEYPNLPKGASFAVLAKIAGTEKEIIWRGSVEPGQSPRLTLATDLRVAGHVTSASTGSPVVGAEVLLRDETPDDLGSPVLASTMTDQSGAYRFDNLPNCLFNVRLGDLSKTTEKRGVIQSRVGSGAWSTESYDGPWVPKLFDSEPTDLLGADQHEGATFDVDRPVTVCDFRMFNPAIVTVEFVNPNLVPLWDCSIHVSDPASGSGAGSGEDIGLRQSVPFVVSPGKHTITISRFAEDADYTLVKIDVKPGEDKRILCALPKSFGLRPMAPGAESQSRGFKMFDVSVRGSDGRAYNLQSLTAGRPVFLVNFSDWAKPSAFADMNRLSRMLAGKVRVVGVVYSSPREIPKLVKKHHVRFLLVGGTVDEPGSEVLLIRQFGVGPDGRTVYVLASALVLPDGRMTHVWSGYNRSTLRQMEIDLRKSTGIRLSLDLSRFPRKLRVGDHTMYGSPGP